MKGTGCSRRTVARSRRAALWLGALVSLVIAGCDSGDPRLYLGDRLPMLDAEGVRQTMEHFHMRPEDVDCMVEQSTTATSIMLGNMRAFTEEQANEWAARCNIDVSKLYRYAD